MTLYAFGWQRSAKMPFALCFIGYLLSVILGLWLIITIIRAKKY